MTDERMANDRFNWAALKTLTDNRTSCNRISKTKLTVLSDDRYYSDERTNWATLTVLADERTSDTELTVHS
jgi:hypothetical protein